MTFVNTLKNTHAYVVCTYILKTNFNVWNLLESKLLLKKYRIKGFEIVRQ